MAQVTFNYWAAARAAAGTASETVSAATVGAALELVVQRRSDPRFLRVIRASSLLLDGSAVGEPELERALDGPVQVEILPPFAGG